jgi:hypothetical protein
MYYSQAGQDEFIVNVLQSKQNGFFLEIGSHDPVRINNTYTLEKNFNWSGIMVEYLAGYAPLYREFRPNSFHVLEDATQVDYKKIFELTNMPFKMDYLQIDLEVNNRSTLTTLERLDATMFDTYTFATVTFEHDIYTGNHFDTRKISREIFNKRGYLPVFQDVCDHSEGVVFEDWYVHPDLVDMDYVTTLIRNNSKNYNNNGITGKSINCQNIQYH